MPDPTDQLFDMSNASLNRVALAAFSAFLLQGGCHVRLDGDVWLVGQDAHAEQTRRTPRKSQPVPPTRAAPDMTGTIPASKVRTQKPDQDEEALPKPFDFPATPRARMRICGEKWQVIKMTGRAADQTWRDFAAKCLVERDEPKTTSP